VGWEDFLRHVVTGAAIRSDLAAGIRDLAFAEACLRSAAIGVAGVTAVKVVRRRRRDRTPFLCSA
jgi:hypothetical protein